MANMKGPREKLSLIALRQAADDVDHGTAPDMQKDTDAMTEKCKCPKCGYESAEDDFKEQ